MRRILAIIWVMGLLVMAPAHAVTLVDQGSVDTALLSFCSDLTGCEQEGDDVSFTTATTLTGVSWSGEYFGGVVQPDDFTIRLFEIVLGVPDINPVVDEHVGAVTRIATGAIGSRGDEIYDYSAAINAIVAAGDYLFSIVNDVPGNWQWSAHDNTVGGFFRNSDADPWGPHFTPTDFAFVIEGTVPEPTTLLLLGLGLAGLGFARKRLH